ncbi:hypothetical protein MHBO_004450, partial [Bonamia ostreae]
KSSKHKPEFANLDQHDIMAFRRYRRSNSNKNFEKIINDLRKTEQNRLLLSDRYTCPNGDRPSGKLQCKDGLIMDIKNGKLVNPYGDVKMTCVGLFEFS